MEEFKSKNSEIPFDTQNLIDSHISKTKRPGKLFEAENFPNKIIRAENPKELSSRHGNKIEISELVENAKRLYKELEERYGIYVPFDDFYTGKDKEGKDVVYCVVNKIEGKHLDDVEISEEFTVQVEILYTSVAKYFLDKYKEGGLHLWDINGQSQYVYGKKFGEQEDKIYLIDTDIWMSKSSVGMYLVVEWLARHMSGMERQLNKKFEKARDYMTQFLGQPLPENMSDSDKDSVNKNIDQIKKFLSGESFDFESKNAIPPFE